MTKILLIVFISIATVTALFTLVYTITDIIREYRQKRRLEALTSAAEEALAAATNASEAEKEKAQEDAPVAEESSFDPE